MAIKTIYLGSEGPFKYDDTELVNDPDGLFAGILQNTIVTDGNLFGVVVGGAKFDDLNASNVLEIKWNEDDTVDRTLNFLVNTADRSINLSGDLVVSAGAGTLDQSVASGAGPTFSPALHAQGTDTSLGVITSNIAMAGAQTVDGRDVSVDGSKLDGIEALADVTDAVNIASSIVGVADKSVLVNADSIALIDSEAANALKETTWTSIKAFLKTYFDGLYGGAGASHTQGTDTALGALGTKNPPIDADKVIYRDSVASDALVTSTWTQVKAFLKTYFDTLYNKYVLENHASNHVNGTDDIQSATAAQKGVATAAQITKLDGIATGATVGFVDRGDPVAHDFSLANFTTDGTWRDLDLSTIVPAGAKAVLVKVIISDGAVNSQFALRKNGNTNTVTSANLRTQAVDVYHDGDMVVALDGNRFIEYYGDNLTFSAIYLSVKGWFF